MNPIAQWQEWQDFIVHRVEDHGRLTHPENAKGGVPVSQSG